jgi:hypothetical protein
MPHVTRQPVCRPANANTDLASQRRTNRIGACGFNEAIRTCRGAEVRRRYPPGRSCTPRPPPWTWPAMSTLTARWTSRVNASDSASSPDRPAEPAEPAGRPGVGDPRPAAVRPVPRLLAQPQPPVDSATRRQSRTLPRLSEQRSTPWVAPDAGHAGHERASGPSWFWRSPTAVCRPSSRSPMTSSPICARSASNWLLTTWVQGPHQDVFPSRAAWRLRLATDGPTPRSARRRRNRSS